MTSIPSSLAAINSVSQLSIDSLLLDAPNSQQDQSNAANIFGSSYSLNLSDAALSALSGNSSAANDSAQGILSPLTYSNTAGNSSNPSGLDALLGSFGLTPGPYSYSAGAVVPTSTSGPSFAAAELADGGPLPAFLAYVDKAMNLDSTQVQSLNEIATAFQNAPGTAQTVNEIAESLQQAGIPETI